MKVAQPRRRVKPTKAQRVFGGPGLNDYVDENFHIVAECRFCSKAGYLRCLDAGKL